MGTPTNFAIDEQAALSFAIEQHTHSEASVNEAPRPEIQYPRLVDVDTSAPDYAKTITYFSSDMYLSLIHISEPTRLGMISYAVFCLKKKK